MSTRIPFILFAAFNKFTHIAFKYACAVTFSSPLIGVSIGDIYDKSGKKLSSVDDNPDILNAAGNKHVYNTHNDILKPDANGRYEFIDHDKVKHSYKIDHNRIIQSDD